MYDDIFILFVSLFTLVCSCSERERLLAGPRCSHCLSSIWYSKDWLSCRSKLLLSKLAAGSPHCIYHLCSTFIWAYLLFFTEILPLLILCCIYTVLTSVILFSSCLFPSITPIILCTPPFIFCSQTLPPNSSPFFLNFSPLSSLSALHRSLFCFTSCLCLSGCLFFSSINGLLYLRKGEKSQVNRCF